MALPLSALLCDYGFDGGWPSIFYILGKPQLDLLNETVVFEFPSSNQFLTPPYVFEKLKIGIVLLFLVS